MKDLKNEVYRPVRQFYIVEALASHAANLLLMGIFFYTHQQFQWGVKQNLMLASAQGMVYVVGALSAGRLSRRIGRRNMLLGLQLIMSALAIEALLMPRPMIVTLVLLVYVGLSAMLWPALESLVSTGASGEVLSRRLAVYNLVWSAVNAVTLAVSGAIIQRWPPGIFVLVIAAHVLSMFFLKNGGEETPVSVPRPTVPLDVEPELLKVRKQALWLSRIALPSTYVVVYSLSAMLPSLPVMQPLPTAWRTLVGSVWLVSRCGAFLVLGASCFWHTRPRLMLAAAGIMLVAFLGTTVRPSDVFPTGHVPVTIDLISMMLWQLLLGVAMGIIYAASLYFGMVLSDGSTEHGGYHEALIGAGSILGPGSAALANMLFPGWSGAGVTAVAGLIALSLLAAGSAAAVAERESA